MIGRELYFNRPKTGEDRLIMSFVVLSAACHLLFFSLDHINFLSMPEPLVEEWSIDTDIITDSLVETPQSTALPETKPAEDVEIPSNLLPQLPKTFNLEETPKAEEDAIEELKEKPKDEGENKTPPVEDAPQVKNKNEDSNVVAMKDAMRRLALERLRKEKKTDTKDVKAPDTSDLARIGEELAKRDAMNQSSGMAGLGIEKKYGAILKKAISQHYTLPQTFTSSLSNLKVIIAITVNERGEISGLRVHKSSNDEVFDDYTIQAAKAASPYQKPPLSLVGKEIHLVFSR